MTKPPPAIAFSHIKGLDGLRGLLALFIVIEHSWGIFFYSRRLHEGRNLFETAMYLGGRGAVLYFFTLSGFVMALSIHKNAVRNSGFRLWEFARSRLLRILPPLFAAILLGWVLECWLASMHLTFFFRPDVHLPRTSFVFDFKKQFQSLISFGFRGDLTGGVNGPLWSLKYEIQCYLLCGLASYVAFARGAVWKRLVIGGLLYHFAHRIHFVLNQDMVCFSAFLSGWLVYWNQSRLTVLKMLQVLCIFFIPWFLSMLCTNLRGFNPCSNLDSSTWMKLNQIGAAILFAFSQMPLQRNTVLSRLKFIGDFSYTLYITHYLLLIFVAFVLFSHVQSISFSMALFLTVGMVLLAMAVAALIASVAEAPAALRYKDNLFTRLWRQLSSEKQ